MPTVATQTERGTYCGLRPGIPKDSPGNCFLKGKRVGFVAGMEKMKTMAQKKSRVMTELTKKSTVKNVAAMIQERGLAYLKSHLKLSKLTKDEVRSIATRYTGTNQAIPRYSTMTVQQLRQELINRGFQP
jgi:hypothetical protein